MEAAVSGKKTLNVALIGCGRIAGHHCRSIVAIEGVNLAAVCDLDQTKAEAYAKEFNTRAFTNYHEMLQAVPEIDIVAVITPSGMHFEHAMDIMKRYGKHLIVEKPTFMKPSEAAAAYKQAADLGLKIFPVFQNRYNKAIQRVRLGLQNGELGKVRVLAVRVRWCRPQRYYDMSQWRGRFAMDGGALSNQGVHHLDLTRYLGGEVKRVNALMRTLGANIEVEDTISASMDFTSGAVGVLEVTTSARPNDYEASISLVCENGLAQIGGIAVNELQVYTPAPDVCKESSENFDGCVYGYGHYEVYRDLAADLAGKEDAWPVSQQDCMNSIKLLNSFYRSDEKQGWVTVDSTDESPRLGRTDEKLANLYRTPFHELR
jgi:UDP-N-acetyl-2-amino-2-deoxyglucuronate dehydrogenase